ncbi:ABC transporter permease [Algisphaera agarilytica]|uniref:Putative ABC transport system permease protein n=1 Tax=Algisphaera agarilytica TaxID=1385975 RepID=A0A7X0H9H0_9BACT|nr:ABC transporter permease [Algisphaera agarilytica]MBB6430254.1 putative ABC transport system permease protein [Algisphaera agarilytica]
MNFLFATLRLGLANLWVHKLRSLLTALGIIIGVGAVVAIAAYGEGTKRAAIQDIMRLGANNIIIRSVKPPGSNVAGQNEATRLSEYGLTRKDVRRLKQTVQPIERMVELKRVGDRIRRGTRSVPGAVFGTTPGLQEAASLTVERGRYLTDSDNDGSRNFAVIGAEVAELLFPLDDPVGGSFLIDTQRFVVVGVLRRVGLAGGAGTALVGRDLNYDIHIPLRTANTRFGDVRQSLGQGSRERTKIEISEVIVQLASQDQVRGVAAKIERLIDTEHSETNDVSLIVPLELIEQAERVQFRSNVLMIVIGGLSLFVGGVGIMNIMLASVTERTREIGIRRALGATRRHIVAQFLVETTTLSCVGGLIGVGCGLAVSLGLQWYAQNFGGVEPPVVMLLPVAIAFSFAVLVGIAFGLYPAVRASQQDPIVALRHD